MTDDHATCPALRRLGFVLDPAHEAHEPPEAPAGRPRRACACSCRAATPHRVARTVRPSCGEFLGPGDLLVVNTSATVAAAVDGRLPDGEPVVRPLLRRAARRPAGWSRSADRVERHDRAAAPATQPADGRPAGAADAMQLLAPLRRLAAAVARDASTSPTTSRCSTTSRATAGRSATATCRATGRSRRTRPSSHASPGSAEMPSAARPFTAELVTDLVRRGVAIAPLVLHTGVSSLEGDERPYPERYRVPARHRRARRTRRTRRRARDRRRHHRRAGARDRHRRPRRRAPRQRAGPTSSSRRDAACARSTACSPAGTSPRRRTC